MSFKHSYKTKISIAKAFWICFAMVSISGIANAGTKFIPNGGQWSSNILYEAGLPSGAFYLEKNQITYFFFDEDALHQVWHNFKQSALVQNQVIRVQFEGSTGPTAVNATGVSSNEYYNYFIGKDRSKWVGKIHATDQVTMQNLWNGIDLVIQTSGDGIKYSFIVHPGADPSLIKLRYLGADSTSVDESDTLRICSHLRNMTELPPVSYQYRKGLFDKTATYSDVESNYKQLEPNLIGFEAHNYSKHDTLTIDPILIFSTFSGSKADNFGFTGTFNPAGNGFSGGTVYAPGYPTTTGAFEVNYQGGATTYDGMGNLQEYGRDVGILKYTPDGTQLVWCTYLGGKNNEQPHSMIVNSKDELIVFGTTASDDFPVTPNAYDTTYHGNGDIYIAIFSEDGSKLIASTYVGGGGRDGFNGSQPYSEPTGPLSYNYGDAYRGEVIVDNADNILVASCTQSNDLITKQPFQSNFGGVQDGLVMKLSADLSTLDWMSFLGGSDQDAAYGIHLDSKQNIFVCGGTQSTDFPTTIGTISPTYNGGIDGFLVKISPDGSKISAATYMGTPSYDQNYLVQVDESDQVYVTGQSLGQFPVIGKVYSNPNSKQYIAQIDNNLDKILNSTVFGAGTSDINLSPSAFLVDVCGRVYVSGWGGQANNWYNPPTGNTNGLALTSDAFQRNTNGSNFYLMILSKDMTNLVYATYFGGLNSQSEEHVDGGTSRFDRNGIVYQSVCGGCGGYSDFPTTVGAWSRKNKGVRAFDKFEGGCNNAMFKIDLNSADFPPKLDDTVIVTSVGDTINYSFTITDPQGDSVYAHASGTILNAAEVNPPAVFVADSGLGQIKAHFMWPANCNQYLGDTIVVAVSARNNSCPVPRTVTHYIKIVIKRPPIPPVPEMFCIEHVDNSTVRIRWTAVPPSKNLGGVRLVKVFPNGVDSVVYSGSGLSPEEYVDPAVPNNMSVNYGYFLYSVSACGVGNDTGRTAHTVPEADSIPNGLNVFSVSVENNKNIRLLWNQYPYGSFHSYIIYRKEGTDPSAQFEYYKVITSQKDTSYLDSNVNVQSTSYCYQIYTVTQCGLVSLPGNEGCSIVLKGSSIPFVNNLSWNPYQVWTNGVYKYEVVRRDPSKPDSVVGSLTSATNLVYADDSLNYDEGIYWYHIVALSGTDSNSAKSVSNEIQLIQKPILYVPNAFTPNKDNVNDKWGFVPVFVKDFQMNVFNRWGEFVWHTNDKHIQWDGTYKGEQPSNDAFIWQVDFTGWDNSQNFNSGYVTTLP